MALCIVCEHELDQVLRTVDFDSNEFFTIDWWCPECHTTITDIFYSNGISASKIVKGK